MLDAPIFSTACLETLNDEREESWDEGVECFLDKEYADWKELSGTHMVPGEFLYRKRKPDKGEETEKKFYDLLQEFGESCSEPEPMFVVHSYKFVEMISEWNKESSKEEKKWVAGEHDFVIIHRQHGIIFFQVKAAAKIKKRFREAEEQLEKDKKALKAFINENLPSSRNKDMNFVLYKYPGFVVMPNCPSPKSSKPPNGVFKEDCKDVGAFSDWWKTKVAEVKGDTQFDQTLFEHLVKRFVGMSHSILDTLSKSIDDDKKKLETCTKQQLSVVLDSEPKKWITGPAGSGKTWLLMKKVLMLAKKALLKGSEEKILVACYNKPLSMMFARVFKDKLFSFLESGELEEVVEVKTFESLLFDVTGPRSGDSDQEKENHVSQALEVVEQRSAFAQQYDHVFVDECQDLYGNRWQTLFERLLKDEDDFSFDEPKHLWFLYDTNQYLRLSEEQYKQHWKSIRKSAKLTKVFRSTGSIFDQSKKYFRAENSNAEPIALGHNVRGPEITWDNSLKSRKVTEDAGAACIAKHIKELRRNKVVGKDICILTQNVEIQEGISSELNKMGIETQNAADLFGYDLHVNKVVVESIWRFKGLESKVVVLYNPPFFQDINWSVKKVKELLYTAVSRCFCYLVVITTIHGCNALRSEEGITEQEIKHGRQEASIQSSERLKSEYRLQVHSFFNDPFSKRGRETQYESGPPEHESPFKRSIEDDNDDVDPDDIKCSPAKLLRKEEADHLYKKISKNMEKRPVKVPGCDLLEPGDPNIKDSIRNNGIKLLEEPVKQNLRYRPGSSDRDESFKDDDITSVVAWIEYKMYDQRRREINPKKYTQDCRTLKKEIMDSTKDQTCHESVLNALHKFQATKHS